MLRLPNFYQILQSLLIRYSRQSLEIRHTHAMIEIQYLTITLAHTMPDTKYICQHSCRQTLISHYQEYRITLQNILRDDTQRHAPNLRQIWVLCLREIPLSKTATNLHDNIIVLLDVTPFLEQSFSFQNFLVHEMRPLRFSVFSQNPTNIDWTDRQ